MNRPISSTETKGLHFKSPAAERRHGLCVTGIEPTPARSGRAGYARLNLSAMAGMDMNLQRVGTRIISRPYRKPGNAYAYIPFTSFHVHHAFRGWVLAELLRLMTHSSAPKLWKEEGSTFCHHLCPRGYPRRFLRAVFQEGHTDTEV
jgi:hypothetical protein